MYNSRVPFVSNTPDDTHCFQATVAMVLGYFLPQNHYTFEELDRITEKPAEKWTWPMAGLLWFAEHNFEVKHVEQFDFERFASAGKEYLVELYGKDVADTIEKESEIGPAMQSAGRFQTIVGPEYRIPNVHDLTELLTDGYVLICSVNARALNGREGYIGHFVVVYNIHDDSISFHDPGLPAQEARNMSSADFEKGWAYPNEAAKSVSAIRLRKV